MTGTQLAITAGCTPARVSQLKDDMIQAGVAETDEWGKTNFYPSAVQWLKTRPKNYGKNSSLKKNLAIKAEVKLRLGQEPETVFYNYCSPKGWGYRFKGEQDVFLGLTFDIAIKNVSFNNTL